MTIQEKIFDNDSVISRNGDHVVEYYNSITKEMSYQLGITSSDDYVIDIKMALEL